jgi:hypothetical protein
MAPAATDGKQQGECITRARFNEAPIKAAPG